MYADDITIYFNLGDFDLNNFEFEINAELQKVSMWLKKIKLSLNLDKIKLMIFHRQQKRVKELNITINGTNIKRVQSFNFLGITLSESMSWVNHLSIYHIIKRQRHRIMFEASRTKTISPSVNIMVVHESRLLTC